MKKGIIILLVLILILFGLAFVFAYQNLNQEEKEETTSNKNMEVEYYDQNISLDRAMNNLIIDFREERDLYLDPEIRNQIRLKYVSKLKLLREKYLRKWD